jgi:hypothetical protein
MGQISASAVTLLYGLLLPTQASGQQPSWQQRITLSLDGFIARMSCTPLCKPRPLGCSAHTLGPKNKHNKYLAKIQVLRAAGNGIATAGIGCEPTSASEDIDIRQYASRMSQDK